MLNLSTVGALKHIKAGDNLIEISGDKLLSLQSALLMMLKDIVAACNESGARYTLSGGTCLGTVRHHGFIPWDDDIDINMAHADFAKFAHVLTEMFPNKYTVHFPGESEGYDYAFPQVRLNGTVMRGHSDVMKPSSECGISVDIFYLENVPDNYLSRQFQGFASMALGLICSCRRFAKYADEYNALVADDSQTRKVFARKIRIGKFVSFWTTERWVKAWDNWNSRCKNEKSERLTIPTGRNHYFGEMLSRSDFFPTVSGDFDGVEAELPGVASAYLEKLYGPDYMTPPSVEDREVHVVYELSLGKYGQSEEAES